MVKCGVRTSAPVCSNARTAWPVCQATIILTSLIISLRTDTSQEQHFRKSEKVGEPSPEFILFHSFPRAVYFSLRSHEDIYVLKCMCCITIGKSKLQWPPALRTTFNNNLAMWHLICCVFSVKSLWTFAHPFIHISPSIMFENRHYAISPLIHSVQMMHFTFPSVYTDVPMCAYHLPPDHHKLPPDKTIWELCRL